MDMVFVMENDAWETQKWMKPKYASPVACLAKTSEREAHQVTSWWWKGEVTRMRKWLHVHDESKWSLITSLICRFWVPFEESAGHSLRRMFPLVVILIGPYVAPIYKIQDEVMFHDGNSDHSVSGRLLSEGWSRHHVCSLSRNVESRVSWGNCTSSTSDLHCGFWQSGENCQVVSAEAFTLLYHAFWFSLKGCSSPCFFCFCCLAHALSALCFPSYRPDTASLISGSRREMSLQALMKFEGPAITWNCFWVLPHSRYLHRSRPFILCTLRRAPKVLRLVALGVSPTIVDDDSTNFLKTVSLCRGLRACTCLLSSQSVWISPFLVPPFLFISYVRLGLSLETLLDPGWRHLEESPYGVFISIDDPVFQSTDYSDCIPGTTRISKQCDPVPCETTTPRDKPHFWKRLEAPLPPLRPRPKCNFIHPQHAQSLSWTPVLALFRAMQSCQATKMLSSQDRITLLCGARWALTRSWPNMRLIFTKIWQISVKSSQTYGINKYFLLNHLCRGGSASPTGTLEPTWEGRRIWEKIAEKWHIFFPARSVWLCWSRYSSRTISRDTLCRLRDPLQ